MSIIMDEFNEMLSIYPNAEKDTLIELVPALQTKNKVLCPRCESYANVVTTRQLYCPNCHRRINNTREIETLEKVSEFEYKLPNISFELSTAFETTNGREVMFFHEAKCDVTYNTKTSKTDVLILDKIYIGYIVFDGENLGFFKYDNGNFIEDKEYWENYFCEGKYSELTFNFVYLGTKATFMTLCPTIKHKFFYEYLENSFKSGEYANYPLFNRIRVNLNDVSPFIFNSLDVDNASQIQVWCASCGNVWDIDTPNVFDNECVNVKCPSCNKQKFIRANDMFNHNSDTFKGAITEIFDKEKYVDIVTYEYTLDVSNNHFSFYPEIAYRVEKDYGTISYYAYNIGTWEEDKYSFFDGTTTLRIPDTLKDIGLEKVYSSNYVNAGCFPAFFAFYISAYICCPQIKEWLYENETLTRLFLEPIDNTKLEYYSTVFKQAKSFAEFLGVPEACSKLVLNRKVTMDDLLILQAINDCYVKDIEVIQWFMDSNFGYQQIWELFEWKIKPDEIKDYLETIEENTTIPPNVSIITWIDYLLDAEYKGLLVDELDLFPEDLCNLL